MSTIVVLDTVVGAFVRRKCLFVFVRSLKLKSFHMCMQS